MTLWMLWLWAAAFLLGVVVVWLLLHRATRRALDEARTVDWVVHRPPTSPPPPSVPDPPVTVVMSSVSDADTSASAPAAPASETAWMQPAVLAEAYRQELWLVRDEYLEIWRAREQVIEQGKALSDYLGVLTLKAEAARQQYRVLHQAYAGLNGGQQEASEASPTRIRLQEKA